MRKVLLILTCMLVVVAAAWMLARQTAGSATAPDIKVTFLGLTNGTAGPSEDARFEVWNRGEGYIRVMEVEIWGSEPYVHIPLPGTVLAKPVTLKPGARHEFRTAPMYGPTRWRGVVTVNVDTPTQRFRDWLRKQTWNKYLPSKWQPDRSGVYIYSSPWESPKLPPTRYPAI
ncbi:MAG TPA: hypothetical protein VEC99_00635 [Clostridia bacterium]|nr:hypothetical protein [Clostridia bacterium]